MTGTRTKVFMVVGLMSANELSCVKTDIYQLKEPYDIQICFGVTALERTFTKLLSATRAELTHYQVF